MEKEKSKRDVLLLYVFYERFVFSFFFMELCL